ncbi:glycosyltransferase family 2 protein [Methylococcus capsulatus]|uniref:glycosyltransferase family 2 protein n=1 Tax=Methylococcus capsulatus TaxID=414 RepID=UPI001C52C11D|nr:glycosyltransferase family 2 protein [Methylococcus capsulatus]QXP94877.1 glycosyltransferase [Methylococcus capsulatus]
MSDKLFSIVTISFNQAQFLREAVESVLAQKGGDIEYIVVDPGSTDGSREILAEYRSAIDHLILEADHGPGDGLNKGFARANGRYGYFLNSDDFLLPGAIDIMRTLWQRHKNTDVLLCGAWMVDENRRPQRELRPSPVTLEKLLDGEAKVVQQGMSFRMDLFRKVGGFNVGNRTCWDYELLCDFLAAGAAVTQSEARLAAFRIHSASISGGIGGELAAKRYLADLDSVYERLTGQKKKPEQRRRSVRLSKRLGSPSHVLLRMRELLAPWTLELRWQADHERKSRR